jgi:hypothetical protein
MTKEGSVVYKRYIDLVKEGTPFNLLYVPVDTSDLERFIEENKHLLYKKKKKIKNGSR